MNRVGNQIRFVEMLAPALRNNTVYTAPIDLNGLDGQYLTVVAIVGATDAGIATNRLQSSPDNSTWTDIPNTTIALFASTDDNRQMVWQLPVQGQPRYIRATGTIGSGAAGANIAVLGILSDVQNGTIASQPLTYGAGVLDVRVIG